MTIVSPLTEDPITPLLMHDSAPCKKSAAAVSSLAASKFGVDELNKVASLKAVNVTRTCADDETH